MTKTIIELSNVLDDSNLEDAERLLRSFYRTIEPHKKRNWKDPVRISWEVFAEKDRIGFYVVVPSNLERLIKSRIRDAYNGAEVRTISEDYTHKFVKPFTAEMELNKHYMFSTKTNAGDVPLNSILNSMSRLEDGDRMLLQITMLPINNTWQGKAYNKYRQMLFEGKKPKKPNKFSITSGILYSISGLFKIIEFFYNLGSDGENKNTPIEREELKGTQKKISMPAFNTNIRLAVESKNQNISSTRLSELANSFIELDYDNEWRRVKTKSHKTMKFIRDRKVDKRTNNIATTKELSPIVRLTNKNIHVPELKKALKTLPIPQGLDEGLFFAHGLHNSESVPVYMNKNLVDDLVHPSIITGAMGAGKSTLINNMMLERAIHGYSTVLIDTQGDLSIDFLNQLPKSEHDRVVWLNFGDLNNPPALDLLEFANLGDNNKVDTEFVKDIAKSELISIMKKMWGQNFGPQTEYITRNNITATIETGGTFMELFRMLVDDEFREEITMQIRDKAPFAFSFFRTFQDNYNINNKMRMMMPSINKIGSFVESPMIRNILCQGEQNYNFREMMDSGKIVVVTIPKGILVNAWKLIGSLIISKVWLASLSRANQPIEDRKPCFIASDEAEDIINDNFPIMLSQSRKFRLGIILGFQYLEQIKQENKKVYTAILGNKPNYFALKIGERDLDVYAEIFKDYYKKDELRSFPNLHGVSQVSINGLPTSPFTIKIPYNYNLRNDEPRENNKHLIEKIAKRSRELYTKPLHEVEETVTKRYQEVLQNLALVDEQEDFDYEVKFDT
ncbi:MAG: hypothetical protein ABS939_20925, partial [Psychrobacillus sp.]